MGQIKVYGLKDNDRLIGDGCFSGYKIQIVKVDYEFAKGGNKMLVIKVQ
ncbi:hypothetical protein ACJDU8_15035 [Clostridium sp. WILCCON 0269]|uniref:Uncharacterized protein n=1 Tax=Candidatus Clostridium eludens TaxID=3381663 RepID=A0ABW8SMI7_9CLOT